MSKVLVLGGNGVIGQSLIKKLMLDNKLIVTYHNNYVDYGSNNIEYEYLDFTKCNDFTRYLKGVDKVVHMISTVLPSDNLDDVSIEIENNVFPTLKLLDDMKKMNVKEIIFISSGGTVYGNHSIEPIFEIERKNPICNYGVIKSMIEDYLLIYKNYYGINCKIARVANPYSANLKKNQGIIPIVIEKIRNDEIISIWGDGTQIRDYIYIDDLIDALMLLIDYDGKENIFNIGTGVGYSLNDLIEIICRELNINDVKIDYLSKRLCDVDNNVLAINKIESELKWKPLVTINSGIRKILKK